MRPIWVIRIGALAFIAALLALIVAASFEESLGDGLRAIVSRRWGLTTLVDLYAGLFLVGVWIAVLERRAWRAALWCVALAGLGHLVTMVYLVIRAFRFATVREALGCAANPGERPGARDHTLDR